MKIPSFILNLFGKPHEDPKPDELKLALTAMASLPQWPVFVQAMAARREQWLNDAKSPSVYQSHAELVQVSARAAECEFWLELYADASRTLHGPDGPA